MRACMRCSHTHVLHVYVRACMHAQVLQRLARLEGDLSEERTKREAAEVELQRLLTTAAASGTRPAPSAASQG